MAGYIKRRLTQKVLESLKKYPVTAVLGPRQSGKSTLAQQIITKNPKGLYLDLERPSHLNKLREPEYFLTQNKDFLICMDEIQRLPEIFPLLRSLSDEHKRNGQFLLLGSSGKDLLRQSSESLTGRIAYWELSPFTLPEISKKNQNRLWFRGGFPKSFLNKSDKLSAEWRENYIRTFLEADIPQLGLNVSTMTVGRLWSMLAHFHGQILNLSKLAGSLGISSPTASSYIDILKKTFLIRYLEPYSANLKKRLVRSPKVYIRDSGILHSLLNINSFNDLLGHPVFGPSYEGFVIENIFASLPKSWQFYFYRTRAGAEIDLLMLRGQRRVAVEIKAGKTPHLSKGFWIASQDVQANEKYLIAPVDSSYYLKGKIKVLSLTDFLKEMN